MGQALAVCGSVCTWAQGPNYYVIMSTFGVGEAPPCISGERASAVACPIICFVT
jgi:hypothetical protein